MNLGREKTSHVTELVRTDEVLLGDRGLTFFADKSRPQKGQPMVYNTNIFYLENLIKRILFLLGKKF